MSGKALAHAAAAPARASFALRSTPLVQRKCACGSSKSPLDDTCDECRSRMLQRQLAVGSSDDPLEHEADRVAAQVVSRSPGAAISAAPVSIWRLTASNKGDHLVAAPQSVDRVLAGSGAPLEPSVRNEMEGRFGHDFSRVRVHTGPSAAQSARDVDAHAYTVGNAIVFDAGRFAPRTVEGGRLLAHELTHVVQQAAAQPLQAVGGGAARRAASTPLIPSGLVQREVSPKRVSKKEEVLAKIKGIVDSNGKGSEPAEANLIRLAKLGVGFNPGATKEEKDNAFVYTCHCGWIDMGHFFISAAAAYAVGYQRRRLEVRVGGTAHSVDELLKGGSNRLSTVLNLLLKTVPDIDGQQVLSDLRRLLESGEPRDIGLAFGYWMEFVQQVAKVIHDPGRKIPEPLKVQLKEVVDEYDRLFKSVAPEGLKSTLEGSARSAFTMEDLPSDCYGAALGQDIWKQSDGAKRDLPRIHELMTAFFSECRAVYPERDSKVYCDMMAETTPGFSCKQKDGEYEDLGEPARHGSTKPRLLNSAKRLCGDAPAVVSCRSGTGGAGSPLPLAVADVSGSSATVTLTEDIAVHQPRERAYFGGDVSIPGRPERFDPRARLVLEGPSMLRITPKGNVIASSRLGGIPNLGDINTAAHLDPSIGRYGAGGNLGLRGRFDLLARGALRLELHGKLDIDLEALLQGLAGPELKELKAVFSSNEFAALLEQYVKNEIGNKAFIREVKSLLKKKFPQGVKGIAETVIWRLEQMEALALATRLEASGTVSIGSLPISGFIVHKSFGRRPVLGVEAGAVVSELVKGRTIVGGKGWLYAQDVLQAQLVLGVDPIARKALADLHLESKMILSGGRKMTFDVQYEINSERDQKVLGLVGWEFEAFGSKPRGAK